MNSSTWNRVHTFADHLHHNNATTGTANNKVGLYGVSASWFDKQATMTFHQQPHPNAPVVNKIKHPSKIGARGHNGPPIRYRQTSILSNREAVLTIICHVLAHVRVEWTRGTHDSHEPSLLYPNNSKYTSFLVNF